MAGREEKGMRPSRGSERVVDFGSPPVIVALGLLRRRKLGSLVVIPALMRYAGEVKTIEDCFLMLGLGGKGGLASDSMLWNLRNALI